MYQTLASVAGAPQLALSWASSASVVASVVSSTWLKPIDAAVAPPIVSLPGAAANAGCAPSAEAATSAATVAMDGRTRMEPQRLAGPSGPRNGMMRLGRPGRIRGSLSPAFCPRACRPIGN